MDNKKHQQAHVNNRKLCNEQISSQELHSQPLVGILDDVLLTLENVYFAVLNWVYYVLGGHSGVDMIKPDRIVAIFKAQAAESILIHFWYVRCLMKWLM